MTSPSSLLAELPVGMFGRFLLLCFVQPRSFALTLLEAQASLSLLPTTRHSDNSILDNQVACVF